MKRLARALVLLASLAAPLVAAAGTAAVAPITHPGVVSAPLPASKELYSFADLYRLAVAGEHGAAVPLPAPDAGAGVQFRVRNVSGGPGTAQAAAYVFSIGTVAQPQGGLLAFAGIAAVLWVARRRLGFPIRR
jgi:hypothetical protein